MDVWEYIIIAAVLVLGCYAFKTFAGFQTRQLSRKSDRSAESMYGNYADEDGELPYARRHKVPPHDS